MGGALLREDELEDSMSVGNKEKLVVGQPPLDKDEDHFYGGTSVTASARSATVSFILQALGFLIAFLVAMITYLVELQLDPNQIVDIQGQSFSLPFAKSAIVGLTTLVSALLLVVVVRIRVENTLYQKKNIVKILPEDSLEFTEMIRKSLYKEFEDELAEKDRQIQEFTATLLRDVEAFQKHVGKVGTLIFDVDDPESPEIKPLLARLEKNLERVAKAQKKYGEPRPWWERLWSFAKPRVRREHR